MNSSAGRRQRQRANRRSKRQRVTRHAYRIEQLRKIWNEKVQGWLEEIDRRGRNLQLIKPDRKLQVFDIVDDAQRYLRIHPRIKNIVGDGALATLRHAAAKAISRATEPSLYRPVGHYSNNRL